MVKRWLTVLILPILLAGCAAVPGQAAAQGPPVPESRRQRPYAMILPQSDRLTEVSRSEEGFCREAPDGSCYLVAAVTPADRDEAITALTGFRPEALRPVLDRCWGMRRSRFSWTTQTGEGTYLCRGQILSDGDWCYCVAVCCREDADGAVRALCTQIFTGLGLYTDEGA